MWGLTPPETNRTGWRDGDLTFIRKIRNIDLDIILINMLKQAFTQKLLYMKFRSNQCGPTLLQTPKNFEPFIPKPYATSLMFPIHLKAKQFKVISASLQLNKPP